MSYTFEVALCCYLSCLCGSYRARAQFSITSGFVLFCLFHSWAFWVFQHPQETQHENTRNTHTQYSPEKHKKHKKHTQYRPEKYKTQETTEPMLLLTSTGTPTFLSNQMSQTVMTETLSNGAHRSTHHSPVDCSWPKPCRNQLDRWVRYFDRSNDIWITIDSCYEMALHACRSWPHVTANWTPSWPQPNAPHSRTMQPQYVLKVDQIRPSTSQNAPPFTTPYLHAYQLCLSESQ